MNPIPIESLDDPRVAYYRNVKDRELARKGDLFVAEGEFVVRRLLASRYPTLSVLLSKRRVEQVAPLVPDGVPIYVGDDAMIRQILGFKFHSGVIACGRRTGGAALEEIFQGKAAADPVTLVVCPEVSNVDNLGSLIRISAAFGVDAMVLGEHCHDPFWRQSIRVSMGMVFSLPLVRSDDLIRDLRRLKNEWGVQLAATVLDETAEPLAGAGRPPRFGLLFGNEARGLDARQIAACDRRVTIPMKHGTDSLNIAVSAGVFLYHFTRDLYITVRDSAPHAFPSRGGVGE